MPLASGPIGQFVKAAQASEQGGRKDQGDRHRRPRLVFVKPPALIEVGEPLPNGTNGAPHQKSPYQIFSHRRWLGAVVYQLAIVLIGHVHKNTPWKIDFP